MKVFHYKLNRDQIFGLVMLVFSISVMVESSRYGTFELVNYSVSPAFFPVTLGGLMCILSVALVIKTKNLSIATKEKEATLPQKNILILIAAIATIFFYQHILLPYFGFLVGTTIFLAIYMLLLGVRSIPKLCAMSVVTPVVFYYIFQKLFSILLPVGKIF